MIVKGGTAYVDAGSLSLASSEEQTVTGLYSELETALRSNKPVVINLTGTSPAAAVLTEGNSGITAMINGYNIVVTEDDEATVTVVDSGGSDSDGGVQINPFPNGVSFYTSNGVEILSQSVDSDGTANFSCKEYSATFEWFCITLGNLDKTKNYLLEFELQTTEGAFFEEGRFNSGFAVQRSAMTSSPSVSSALNFPDNIVRDFRKRRYKTYFRPVAPYSTGDQPTGTQEMFFVANVWGYSDNTDNYFTISNFKLWQLD